MSIVRWKPRGELFAVQDEINRMFDNLFGGLRDEDSSMLVPPVDITEDEDKFVVMVELPGIKKDEIKLTLKDDSLTISGSKKRESEEGDDRHHRIERAFGSFCRTITLPSKVESGNIAASYKDGVLHVTIPKAAEAKPKEIAIKG